MKKAFTITELLVAVAVLAVTMTAVGGIFKMAIESQRTAGATSEIMRNLRAITDQINADFKGFRASPGPVGLLFDTDPNTPSDPNDNLRSDRLVFFANGDFQSTRQYEYKKSSSENAFKTVVGNVARIWYGQSRNPNPNSFDEAVKRKKLLLRRVQSLTADSRLIDKDEYDPNNFDDPREYDVRSLAKWRVDQKTDMPDPNLNQADYHAWIELWVGRPGVDLADPDFFDPNFIPMIMAKGVDDFTIQFSYWDGGRLKWWPTNQEIIGKVDYSGNLEAIRFAFTLYDSKGILKGGRRFSHTVYLGDRF